MHARTVDRRPLYPAGEVDASSRSASTSGSSGRLAWMDDAACVGADPELFFPERGGKTAAARRICAGCPVQQECEDFALETQTNYDDDHGVWGGGTRRDRVARRSGGRRRSPRPPSPGSKPSAAAVKAPHGSRFYHDRAAAAEAWNLAKQVGGINEAARRLGVSTASLYRAWRRWDLGIPDTSRSPARWERQLHAGGDRQRTFRALERQRRQANGQARQGPEVRVTATSQVA
jgi:WhiB family redox-sensing transcriptional regulator